MRFNILNIVGLKKFVLFGSLITIFCCALGLISFYSASNALYESIRNSFENRATDNANLLSQVVNGKLTELRLIAEDEDIRSMDWDRQEDDLDSHINTLGVKRFRVINKNGLSRSTDHEVLDVHEREYFKKAMDGATNMSDVLRSWVDGTLIIACATPIRDKDNNIVGVLSYTIDYQMLSDLIKNIEIGQKGYAFLINNEGVAVAHPKKESILSEETIIEKAVKDPSLKDLASIEKRMIAGETGSGFYKYDGCDKFAAFTPVEGTNWFLALSIPKSEVFSILDSLRDKFIIETIIFILIALLMYYFILVYSSQRKKVKVLERNADDNYRYMLEVTETDKLKTEFFANITHELRTPINVIFGALQLFEYNINNKTNHNMEDANRRIKVMKQNCLRLLRLINNLIYATKIDSGYYDVNLKNQDIIRVVEMITLSVADYIEGKGIDLIFDTDVEEKEMAFDHDNIEKIMLNLLSNATKFTNKGGSIFVNVFDKGEKIVVSVRDTGIGIPKDKQDIIFERFRQVDKSLTRSHEGSGIGLSLVKSLVEILEGKIYVRSEYGRGSEFIVELPVKVLSEEECKSRNKNYYENNNIYAEQISIEFSDINL